MTNLEGRRVIVTGGAGALGGATLRALRGHGAAAVGIALRGDDDLVACDLRSESSVTAAVQHARDRLGGIDAVVHFAGIGLPTSAGEPPGDVVTSTLDVNLLGAWRVTAAVIDDIVARRGRLVFVASQLAAATIPFATAYTVSKRGLCAYADSVRAEFGTHLGVTTVYPGYVRTPIHDASVAAGLGLDGSVRSQSVEDVVRTVLRALTARRPPRDVACTPWARLELAASRHLPTLTDTVIRARLRREVMRGSYADAPLARAMRARLAGTDVRLRRSRG